MLHIDSVYLFPASRVSHYTVFGKEPAHHTAMPPVIWQETILRPHGVDGRESTGVPLHNFKALLKVAKGEELLP